MAKKATNWVNLLFSTSLIVLLCLVALFPIKAKAEGDSSRIEPEPPEHFNYFGYDLNASPSTRQFGKTYTDTLNADTADGYLCIQQPDGNRYHYLFTIISQNYEIDELYLFDNDDEDSDIWTLKDGFKCKYDKTKKTYTYTYSATTQNRLGFFVINYSNKNIKYTISITREPEIVLSKTAISEITNTKQRTMTVKYAPVKKRLGYQIEYSTDNKFKDKQRVNTGATTKDVGKLTKGKTYYVRVRSYARYNDGSLVYSKWSGTRKIKITK